MREAGLFRSLRTVCGAQGRTVRVDGRELLCFCSNNYLGLANHPALVEAATNALQRWGVGAAASRLISGHMEAHEELERAIAEFKGAEAAIVFPTGYMANVGAITALVGKGDLVVGDKLNHASIVDGCRLSGAAFRVYPHGNIDKLARLLRTAAHPRALVVTDTVFSMDGDLARLRDIVDVAEKHGATVMVDEAHATGVIGPAGRGLAAELGLEARVAVLMGTLSKAVGVLGGFVAGSRDLVDYLRNRARSFVYTTALPPAVCAAAQEGLRLARDGDDLRDRLWRNTRRLLDGARSLGLDTGASQTPIVPILVGDAARAVRLSQALLDRGILAPAIRPPTVPKRASRIRLSVMASHTDEDVDRVLAALASEWREA